MNKYSSQAYPSSNKNTYIISNHLIKIIDYNMGHIAMISIITKAWEGALCPEMDSDNFACRHKKSLKSTEVVAGTIVM